MPCLSQQPSKQVQQGYEVDGATPVSRPMQLQTARPCPENVLLVLMSILGGVCVCACVCENAPAESYSGDVTPCQQAKSRQDTAHREHCVSQVVVLLTWNMTLQA